MLALLFAVAMMGAEPEMPVGNWQEALKLSRQYDLVCTEAELESAEKTLANIRKSKIQNKGRDYLDQKASPDKPGRYNTVKGRNEDKAECEKTIARLKGYLDKATARPESHYPRLCVPFHTGIVGTINERANCKQVIEDGRALVLVQLPPRFALMCEFHTVIASGVDTSEWVDGQGVDLRGLFQVNGTVRYETVLGGSRQVFELRKVAELPPGVER